jgi:hypothetical protein
LSFTLAIGKHQVDEEPPTLKFLSAKTHRQLDCAKERFRVLAVVEYSREMATGKSDWQQVESQNVNQAL